MSGIEPAVRLHVVTGKGGVGKTTVAAALATALARSGRRVLLVEVEGRQGIAELYQLEPLAYVETKIDDGVYALAIDAEAALLEYLEMFYRLGNAGRVLRKLGAIDFVATIAPGLRDILMTGKVKETVTRTRDGRRVYDTVVLDAPPTGRIGRFLNVTAETATLAKVGPIKSQAEGVAAILHSPMTSVHLVTLLEEMPVQETADAVAELRGLDLPIGSVIINGVRPKLLEGARVTRPALATALAAAGLPNDGATVAGLIDEVLEYRLRQRAADRLRDELARLGPPLIELPHCPGDVDLELLARALGPIPA